MLDRMCVHIQLLQLVSNGHAWLGTHIALLLCDTAADLHVQGRVVVCRDCV